MGMVPFRPAVKRPERETARPKEVHPSTLHPEMAPADEIIEQEKPKNPCGFPVKYRSPVMPPQKTEFSPDESLGAYPPPFGKAFADCTPTEQAAKREFVRRLAERGRCVSEYYAASIEELVEEVGLSPVGRPRRSLLSVQPDGVRPIANYGIISKVMK